MGDYEIIKDLWKPSKPWRLVKAGKKLPLFFRTKARAEDFVREMLYVRSLTESK